VIEVFFIVNLTLMPFEQSENQLVEEDPFILKELVEEVAHVIARNDRCEKAKDPFARIHIGPYVVLGDLLMQNWQVCLD